MDLSSLFRTAKNAERTANKIILHAHAGKGKTTLFAYAPDVLFIPAEGEGTGIQKLAEAGLIPDTVRWLPEIKDSKPGVHDAWMQLLTTVHALAKEDHGIKTVVFDCADDGGFLEAAYLHHCDKEYGGDMGPSGFMNFQNGYITVLPEIRRLTHKLLSRLVERGIDVVLLAHSTVGTYKNPSGADYTRHHPLINQKSVWPMLDAWADMVLYLDTSTTVTSAGDGKKGKAKGGSRRVLHCEHRATIEAKNRHGLPAQLTLPEDPSEAYAAFQAALNGGTA